MSQLTFDYFLLYKMGYLPNNPIQLGEPPLNLIAEAYSTGPLLAVAWHHKTQEWIFQPRMALAILHVNSDDHRFRATDRSTAEREALRFATKPLPSETELTQICRAARPD